jgi:DNA-binding NarL/FixJ family response regulator
MDRLLLVEDDSLTRRACMRVLSATHDVDQAETAARARELIAAHAYERAVFDVGLPDGDGLELLDWARRTGKCFPVLMMTGESDRQLASRAFLLGAQLVFKPISANVLRQFAEAPLPVRRRSLEDIACEYAAANELSTRQTEFLYALARGVARRGLASELQIAENTVKTMAKQILERTGLPSTDAIVCVLLEKVAREEANEARSSRVHLVRSHD